MNNQWKEIIHKERKRKTLSGSDEIDKMYFIGLKQYCSSEADNKLGEK